MWSAKVCVGRYAVVKMWIKPIHPKGSSRSITLDLSCTWTGFKTGLRNLRDSTTHMLPLRWQVCTFTYLQTLLAAAEHSETWSTCTSTTCWTYPKSLGIVPFCGYLQNESSNLHIGYCKTLQYPYTNSSISRFCCSLHGRRSLSLFDK